VSPFEQAVRKVVPLVMRLNTFDCAVYHHTNLVPEVYEMDDYQVPTCNTPLTYVNIPGAAS